MGQKINIYVKWFVGRGGCVQWLNVAATKEEVKKNWEKTWTFGTRRGKKFGMAIRCYLR